MDDNTRKKAKEKIEELARRIKLNGAAKEKVHLNVKLGLEGDAAVKYLVVRYAGLHMSDEEILRFILGAGIQTAVVTLIAQGKYKNIMDDEHGEI